MTEPQLTPLVGPEGEQPPGPGDDRRVLVPAGDQDNLVILDPELAGSVLCKLGFTKGEHCACIWYFWILHIVTELINNVLQPGSVLLHHIINF